MHPKQQYITDWLSNGYITFPIWATTKRKYLIQHVALAVEAVEVVKVKQHFKQKTK